MNDDFIYKSLPNVNKGFAESLYAKISSDPQSHPIPRRNFIKSIPRRFQVALIVLGVLVLVAWSQMRLWIRYVPIGDLWLVEFSLSQPPMDIQTVEPIPTPGQFPTVIIDGETLMLQPPFEFLSPGWIPDGFSPTKLPISEIYEESIGMWRNDLGETIRLFVAPKTGGARPYAPPGMYEEVNLNGQPAILIFGRLAPNSSKNPQATRTWDETLGFQLSWSLGESIYTLETLGPYVSVDDLIRMAESMKRVPAAWETTAP